MRRRPLSPQGGSNTLKLVTINLADLQMPDRALRKHPDSQIRKLARSLEKFGWVSPILVTSENEIVAGTARVLAARKLRHTSAPALRVDHLTPEQVRLYRIADNRLAEEADWDREALRLEIAELVDLDLDLELTGFEVGEIDLLLEPEDGSTKDADTVPAAPESALSQPGDVWQIGPHRLVCGDALDPQTYALALEGKHADAVFIDAPYNVKIDRNVCGLGRVRHREFVQASGEMSDAEFAGFLTKAHKQLAEAIKPGGVLFSCMDWRSIATLIRAGQAAELDLINLAVWDKGVGGMGSLYRSQHELVAVFRSPGASHRNNVELGKHGRNRTNVWSYAGMNSASAGRDELLAMHPTVKPVELVADAIKDVTAHGECVLDCFGGSGTTMVAAEKTRRKAVLIELDPIYVDTIILRMKKTTGLDAVHAVTGERFEAHQHPTDTTQNGEPLAERT
jgi:DNA modification methylase